MSHHSSCAIKETHVLLFYSISYDRYIYFSLLLCLWEGGGRKVEGCCRELCAGVRSSRMAHCMVLMNVMRAVIHKLKAITPVSPPL